MISRRHLVAAAPAAFALPGLARAAAARAPLRLAMPMEIKDGATTVTLLINGKGPYRMLVSPSVALNHVAADLVPQLGMRQMADMKMKSTGESGVQDTMAYQADTIFIGGRIHEDNVSFIAAPRMADDIDGALCPWFAGFSAGFDFEGGQFIVLQGGPQTDGFTAVPFVGRIPQAMRSFRQHPTVIRFRSQVRLAGTLDGVPVTLSVDTSLGQSLLLSSNFVRANGLWEKYGKGEEADIRENGTAIESRAVHPAALKLGDLTVAAPDAVLLHGAGVEQGEENVDGYIGVGLLKRYEMWIDWQAGFAYFKLNPRTAV
jgi:hypothetical protein